MYPLPGDIFLKGFLLWENSMCFDLDFKVFPDGMLTVTQHSFKQSVQYRWLAVAQSIGWKEWMEDGNAH